MVSPINRISLQVHQTQEVKSAVNNSEVDKSEDTKRSSKTPSVSTPATAPRDTRAAERKEQPGTESADALRTLASREPTSPPPAPGKNLVNVDAVIAAYKK